MDRQAVRDRAPQYSPEGPEGLRARPRGGRARFLDEGQLSVVRGWVEAGPDPAPDGAGRRGSRKLDPIETAFRYPKNNRLANRVFSDVAAVAEACRKAWERFAAAPDAPDRIASFVRRDRAIALVPAHPRQNA